MHIQYDRDEQDSMTCFTFDSTTEDQEQMRDIIDWLAGLGIRTSKTTIRAPGGSKMICLLVNNVMRETISPESANIKSPSEPTPVKNTPAPKSPPVKSQTKEESSDSEDSGSDSDSEDEPVVPVTQKKTTTKPTVKK